jgi:hypothetical protein
VPEGDVGAGIVGTTARQEGQLGAIACAWRCSQFRMHASWKWWPQLCTFVTGSLLVKNRPKQTLHLSSSSSSPLPSPAAPVVVLLLLLFLFLFEDLCVESGGGWTHCPPTIATLRRAPANADAVASRAL